MKTHFPFFVVLLFTLFPIVVNGQYSRRDVRQKQPIEAINLRIIYDFHFVMDTIRKQIFEDRYALEIGTNHAKFQSIFSDRVDSVWRHPYLFGVENIRRGHASGVNPRLWMEPNQRENQDIYLWNFPTAGLLHVSNRFVVRTYVYTEEIPRIAWQIEDSTQMILGYFAQKATARFRGREWVVWFTPEIPHSLGPWKLSGLPGLVVQAETADGFFRFTMIGIETPTGEYIYRHNAPEITTTRQGILRLWRRSWEDPIGLSNDHGVQMGIPVMRDGQRTWYSDPGSFSFPYRPFLELE